MARSPSVTGSATGAATTPRNAVTGTTHTPRTTYTYDDDGNTTALAVADTTGGDVTRTTAWTYNSHNQVDTVTDPASRTTGYGYDVYGNRTDETAADANTYRYTYSPTGELLTSTLTKMPTAFAPASPSCWSGKCPSTLSASVTSASTKAARAASSFQAILGLPGSV
jgi:YD repeat-containing protein